MTDGGNAVPVPSTLLSLPLMDDDDEEGDDDETLTLAEQLAIARTAATAVAAGDGSPLGSGTPPSDGSSPETAFTTRDGGGAPRITPSVFFKSMLIGTSR